MLLLIRVAMCSSLRDWGAAIFVHVRQFKCKQEILIFTSSGGGNVVLVVIQ